MEIQITEENPTVCPKVKSDEVLSECEDAYVEGFEALRKGKESDSSLPSPINLNVSDAIKVKLPNLKWHKYDVIPRKMKVTNSGRTVILSAKWDEEFPYITGGPFRHEKYVLSDIHFHWGKTANEGSEHLAEGLQRPLEMHVMHTKKGYTLSEAVEKVDGTVTVVYLFEISFHHNPVLQRILLNLENIRQAGTDYHLPPFEISRLVIPFEEDFYFYWGMVTSKEEVCPMMWVINRKQGSISNAQLKLFHRLLDPSLRSISRNWRPVRSKEKRNLFYVNSLAPNTLQTMDPRPILYQEKVHYTSAVSVELETHAPRESIVSGSP